MPCGTMTGKLNFRSRVLLPMTVKWGLCLAFTSGQAAVDTYGQSLPVQHRTAVGSGARHARFKAPF